LRLDAPTLGGLPRHVLAQACLPSFGGRGHDPRSCAIRRARSTPAREPNPPWGRFPAARRPDEPPAQTRIRDEWDLRDLP
jgi:hypothetical protein